MRSVVPPGPGQSYSALICGGIGELGSVYAVYAFSKHVLGVDPQHYWTDLPLTPPANGSIAVAAGAGGLLPGQGPTGRALPGETPTSNFYYRGVFVNDEDMLSGFAEDPLGQSVFSVEMWDHVFEMVLRLRGNAVIVGTCVSRGLPVSTHSPLGHSFWFVAQVGWPKSNLWDAVRAQQAFPDERPFELAARRGLHIAQHHVTILGTNAFQWPSGVPYSFPKSP